MLGLWATLRGAGGHELVDVFEDQNIEIQIDNACTAFYSRQPNSQEPTTVWVVLDSISTGGGA